MDFLSLVLVLGFFGVLIIIGYVSYKKGTISDANKFLDRLYNFENANVPSGGTVASGGNGSVRYKVVTDSWGKLHFFDGSDLITDLILIDILYDMVDMDSAEDQYIDFPSDIDSVSNVDEPIVNDNSYDTDTDIDTERYSGSGSSDSYDSGSSDSCDSGSSDSYDSGSSDSDY